MVLALKNPDKSGIIDVTNLKDFVPECDMAFSLLRLGNRRTYRHTGRTDTEVAFLLMAGTAAIEWPGESLTVQRTSLFDQKPPALHVSSGIPVTVHALSEGVEFAILSARNSRDFGCRFYSSDTVIQATLTSGNLGDVAQRTIRTVLDDQIAPESNMCFGEILNAAGRWSSYPPHHHPQPEIYHYRFQPEGGFGYSGHGDEVSRVRHGDTAVFSPNVTHPQVAAPGYSMYYLWAIPHLKDNRFTGTSRIYEEQHRWILGGS